MGAKNRTDSIADRINGGFVWAKVRTFIDIDILIVASAFVIISGYIINNTPDVSSNFLELLIGKNLYYTGHNYGDFSLCIKNDSGAIVVTRLKDYFDMIIVPAIILVVYEFVAFINSFSYAVIRTAVAADTARRKRKSACGDTARIIWV